MNAVIRYPGSKWSIAPWIISFFPEGYEKMVYLEPFFGSGAVFFNKQPSAVETINDLDGDVVNLFRVLRECPEELKQALDLTPYSREEYDKSFERCEDPVERARRFMIRTNQCIGARLAYHSSWRDYVDKNAGGSLVKWANIMDTVETASKRLRGTIKNLVQIESRDALRLIERYNRPDVLMYLDPPYVRSTRKSGRLYRHEMDDADQIRLLELIRDSRAKVIISGYQSELYSQYLGGWRTFSTMSQTTSNAMATETIWLNYEPPMEQIDLFADQSAAQSAAQYADNPVFAQA